LPYINELVGAGYAVAATDYEGLGTPGVHPYLVGLSEGRGMLDIARAAKRFSKITTTLIFGHSEGGQAALFAGEIAPSYAPDLKVTGVVAAAPAADLETILPAAGVLPGGAGYAVMGATGFQAAYPDANPASILTPIALAYVPLAKTGCAGAVLQALANNSNDVFAHSPLATPPFPTLLHENSAGNVATTAPMLLVQGSADELILQSLTDAFFAKACAIHDDVEYRRYAGIDHSGVVLAAETDVLAWLALRAAGKQTGGSGCQLGPQPGTPTTPVPPTSTPGGSSGHD
jgi:alpha-beta hydrolase superfamily lysophospholipase